MKVGKRCLKMSDGSTRCFKSKAARNRFERVAKAYKAGWRPTGHRRKK